MKIEKEMFTPTNSVPVLMAQFFVPGDAELARLYSSATGISLNEWNGNRSKKDNRVQREWIGAGRRLNTFYHRGHLNKQ